jgi:hypothetical protein
MVKWPVVCSWIVIFSVCGMTLVSCTPVKLLHLCHKDNPYICDAKPDPNDPTRATVSIDCLDSLLTDLELFNTKRDQ